MTITLRKASFAGLMFLAFALSAPHAAGQETLDVEAVTKNLDAFTKRLSALRAEVDSSRFEPDAKLDQLDYEAELLIEFVNDEIAFHPYEGALRGSAGTLRAGAGNSLDQSLLLAYMLKSAGYDSRIARGDLSEDEALRLLMITGNGRVPQSLDYMRDAVDRMAGVTVQPAGQGNLKDSRLYHDTLAYEDRLTSALEDAGIALDPVDATGQFLSSIKPYFWVQHRDGPSQAWQDAHPAFGSGTSSPEVEPVEFFADAISPDYYHTLSVSAWIEQWVNGAIEKHQIMTWSSPVASLVGKSLSFRNAPSGLNLDTADNLADALENTTILVPFFNGAMAPGARAFDMNGRSVDPFALGGGAAGLFQTLGDKLESATEGVTDREDGKPVLALHSMYLEFTVADPSGDSDTRRRYVLPPRTDYNDDKIAIWSLITDHTYTVASGDLPVDYIADRYLEVSIESVDWLEFMVRKTFEPDKGIPLPDELSTGLWPLVQHWSMDRWPDGERDVVRFRASPGVVGVRSGYRDASTTFTAVDVIFNEVQHIRKSETGFTTAPRAALQNGIWDTVLESVPARLKRADPASTASTAMVFELARQQGIDTIVLTPDRTADLAKFGLDRNAQAFLRDDLDNGYAVVLPQRVPDGAPLAGWWRVHPSSGETLGMTGDGYGQESAEYIAMEFIGTLKGLTDGLNAIRECQEEPTMVTQLCCLVNAHANNVMGLGFGSLMGTMLGTATATVFDSAGTIYGEATGESLLPSVGPMQCDSLPDPGW